MNPTNQNTVNPTNQLLFSTDLYTSLVDFDPLVKDRSNNTSRVRGHIFSTTLRRVTVKRWQVHRVTTLTEAKRLSKSSTGPKQRIPLRKSTCRTVVTRRTIRPFRLIRWGLYNLTHQLRRSTLTHRVVLTHQPTERSHLLDMMGTMRNDRSSRNTSDPPPLANRGNPLETKSSKRKPRASKRSTYRKQRL